MSIDCLISKIFIYGLPLDGSKEADTSYTHFQINQKHQQKIYYINKNIYNHKREKIIIMDILIQSNLKALFYKENKLIGGDNSIKYENFLI